MSTVFDTLRALELEIDKKGWDQPALLYTINHDGTFNKVMTVDGHPYDAMMKLVAYGQTFKDNDKVIGLALCTEGWRHLLGRELRDVAKGDPMLADILDNLARIADASDIPKDQEDAVLDRVYERMLGDRRPSEMQDHLRKEVRSIFTVYRDKSASQQIGRERGEEAEAQPELEFEQQMVGRVPAAMFALLTNDLSYATSYATRNA
jgi:hypothetical protein